jgi:two-component system, NarL family, invasion response regulator UvrY
MSNYPITIGVIDDHTLFRKALILLINQFENTKVTLEASNGKELQHVLRKENLPDILLLDLQMPVMNGYDTIQWLQNYFPDLPVIILSFCETDLTRVMLMKMGARAILPKNTSEEELKKAILYVLEAGYYYNDIPSRKILLTLYQGSTKGNALKYLLNDREWNFLKLAPTELTYKEMAYALNTSERGIDKIRNNLFEKLKVPSRVVLAIKTLKNGITYCIY